MLLLTDYLSTTDTTIPATITHAHRNLCNIFFSWKMNLPAKIVTKQHDCLIKVIMVTLLSGSAFAIKRHLSAMTKRMASNQIQGFLMADLRLKTDVTGLDAFSLALKSLEVEDKASDAGVVLL